MMNQHREGVIVLLEKADGQIAFQLRDDKPEILYPNYWGLFGGWPIPYGRISNSYAGMINLLWAD